MTRRSRARGFTLIEALIGVAILAVVLAGIVPAFLSYLRVNNQSDVRGGAVAAAESVLDNLRQTPIAAWGPSGTVLNASGGDRTYEVTVLYCTASLPYCSSDTRHVEAVVRYQGKVYYDVQTVYTRLNAAFN